MTVLNKSYTDNFRQYYYQSEGKSLTQDLLQPLWTFLFSFVPPCTNPGVLTFAGALANILPAVGIMLCDISGKGEAPSWLYLLCGVGVFLHLLFDALDGMQCRATGMNTPLEEIEDHGCDAATSFAMAVAVTSATGLGQYPVLNLVLVLSLNAVFYCYHWKSYVSGIITFRTLDVTEGEVTVSAILILTWWCGTGIWNYPVPVLGVPLKLVLALANMAAIAFNIVSSLMVVLSKYTEGKTTIAGTHPFSPATAYGLQLIVCLCYALLSPARVFESHPMIFFTALVAPSIRITWFLLMSVICQVQVPQVDVVTVGPLLALANVCLGCVVPELYVLSGLAVVVALFLVYTYAGIITDICTVLSVSCWRSYTSPYDWCIPPTERKAHSRSD